MGSLTIKIMWLIITVSVVVVCVWATGKITSPSARDKALRVHTYQRQAEKLFNTAEVGLYNKVSCTRWLGCLRLEPVLAHSETCTPPSTSLRFLPLFGEWMLAISFQRYFACVTNLLRRLKFIRVGVVCVVSLAGGLVAVLSWLLRLSSHKFQRNDLPFPITKHENKDEKDIHHYKQKYNKGIHDILTEKDEDKKNEVQDEDVQDNTLFLQRHVPFMTQQQLHQLVTGRLLGVGGSGSVRQLTYDGTEAVIKELFNYELAPLLREARVLVELNGAGGVPRLLAVCQTPPALVQEFVGKTYDRYLVKCSIEGFLSSLISLTHLLGEIHAMGFVHNDFKINNITFTGSVIQPLFHIIDFGWACRAGQVVLKCDRQVRTARDKTNSAIYKGKKDFSLVTSDDDITSEDEDEDYMYNRKEEDSEEGAPWMAPEVFGGRRVWPSGDVYGFGYLLDHVLKDCPQIFLTAPLRMLADACSMWDPEHRPFFTQVARDITGLAQLLTSQQLKQKIIFKGNGT
uniref:Protein kinase domain-containing protein n=1 Tax=Scylla olivacea TaxID=85551 RepID=A0A0N7ZDB2_SCYOL